ncbi:MAG: ribulose-phosphate 3-epimerase [Planctomycetales bacterium]|nr:ribulose-phosphate 3-epimerase [Planctomycetales bacterium]
MSASNALSELRAAAPAILPSLLLCDFGNLEREVSRLEDAGAPGLHLDVMDGQFVPNLTYGMPIVAALRRLTTLPLDVHLMIERPERYIEAFADAGADVITIHVEATPDPQHALAAIRRSGAAAGLALNPGTPLSTLDDCLSLCDLLLVMSVDAGFGGQAFNPVALEKLAELRQRIDGAALLEVDGGVNSETIGPCRAAGADLFVVGSAIFKQPDYAAAVTQLRQAACAAT